MGRRRDAVRPGRLALARSLLVSALAPWLVYITLRPHVGSAAEALAIGGAIPAAWVLARLALTRRTDWLATACVAVLAVAVAVSLLSGGSALPLELRSSVITGGIGLACVISVVVRRPLPMLLARVPGFSDAARGQRIERALTEPARRRLTVVTAWFGVVMLLDAAARVILAVALPTTTFLAVSGGTSWGIIGGGLGVLLAYLRHTRTLGMESACDQRPCPPGSAQPSPSPPPSSSSPRRG